MSAKKGIQVYGEQALNAIITEYEQFENLSSFTPIHVKTLSPEARKGALHAIDLIKEKRTGAPLQMEENNVRCMTNMRFHLQHCLKMDSWAALPLMPMKTVI